MTRAALAAGALVLATAPAAAAHPGHYGGDCGLTAVMTDVRDWPVVGYTGQVDALVYATDEALGAPDPTRHVRVECWAYTRPGPADPVTATLVLAAEGDGVAAGATPYSFRAEVSGYDYPLHTICARVWVDGVEEDTGCAPVGGPPPAPVYGLVGEVLDLLPDP